MRRPALALAVSLVSAGCAGSMSSERPTMLADRAAAVPVIRPDRTVSSDEGGEIPAPLAHAPSDVQVPTEVHLANGVRVLLIERRGAPLVSVSFLVRFDPNEATTVVPALYAHAMTGGSDDYSSRSLGLFLSAAGVNTHAACEADTILLSATMLGPHAPDVIDRLSATIATPALEGRNLESGQRNLVAQRTWMRKYPSALPAAQRMLLGDAHPARVRVFDTAPIHAAKRDDLVKFERRTLSAENVTVLVAGDFKRADVERVLLARLGKLPARGSTGASAWREPPRLEKSAVAIVPWRGATQSKIAVAFGGPPPRSEDRAALALLADLLSGSTGRLMKKIREEQGASYGVGAMVEFWRSGSAFEINTAVESAHTVAAVQAIVRELGRLSTERIPDDELARSKGRVTARARSAGGSPLGKDLHMLEAIASQDLPLDHFVRLASQIDRLTAEDLRTVATKYLRIDRMQIAVAADPAAVEAPLRALGIADVTIAPPL